jgi:formamidase
VPAVEPYASQALRTIPPRENGGNLDVAQLREGSRLLLPVHVPGALLSVGDAHFAQGEGEVCGTAIEVAATVTLEVSLRRHETLPWRQRFPAIEYTEPSIDTARPCFQTTGIPLDDGGENENVDVTVAARRALLEMIGWLGAERGLSREQAYVLASVAADLRVAEVVNIPNALVTCSLALDVFEHDAPA